MRGIISSVALLAAVAAAPVSAQSYGSGYGYGGSTIRCESTDGRTRECSIPGGGQVQLVRQLSRSACIEGSTWGYGRGGMWVSDGCRGDFQVLSGSAYGYGNQGGYGNSGNYGNQGAYGNSGYYGNQGVGNGYGNGQTVRCESNDGRTQRCALSANPRSVQLVRQLSRSACIQGSTWGVDRGGVWVSQGCRADFAASGSGYGNRDRYGGSSSYGSPSGYGQGYGRLFRCESNDGRTRECAANTRAGVQLVRQLSNSACIQGRTWGYGNNAIWVSQGCRAEFRSY